MTYRGFPYRLSVLVDPRFSHAEREAVAKEVLTMFHCCLDPQFTRKVHPTTQPQNSHRALRDRCFERGVG